MPAQPRSQPSRRLQWPTRPLSSAQNCGPTVTTASLYSMYATKAYATAVAALPPASQPAFVRRVLPPHDVLYTTHQGSVDHAQYAVPPSQRVRHAGMAQRTFRTTSTGCSHMACFVEYASEDRRMLCPPVNSAMIPVISLVSCAGLTGRHILHNLRLHRVVQFKDVATANNFGSNSTADIVAATHQLIV